MSNVNNRTVFVLSEEAPLFEKTRVLKRTHLTHLGLFGSKREWMTGGLGGNIEPSVSIKGEEFLK
jgi:hypothetical protein